MRLRPITLFAFAAFVAPPADVDAQPTPRAPLAPSSFVLKVDGAVAGPITTPSGDLAFTLPAVGVSPALGQWLAAAVTSATKHSGEIVGLDPSSKTVLRRQFVNASVSEIDFPSVDRSSTSPAILRVKLSAEKTTETAGDGTAIATVSPKSAPASRFDFEISNHAVDVGHVTALDAIAVRRAASGAMTTPITAVLYVNDDAAAFQTWLVNGDGNVQKTCTLTYTDGENRPALRVNLHGCFPMKIERVASPTATRRAQVKLTATNVTVARP
jgi:hypothetical protein